MDETHRLTAGRNYPETELAPQQDALLSPLFPLPTTSSCPINFPWVDRPGPRSPESRRKRQNNSSRCILSLHGFGCSVSGRTSGSLLHFQPFCFRLLSLLHFLLRSFPTGEQDEKRKEVGWVKFQGHARSDREYAFEKYLPGRSLDGFSKRRTLLLLSLEGCRPAGSEQLFLSPSPLVGRLGWGSLVPWQKLRRAKTDGHNGLHVGFQA